MNKIFVMNHINQHTHADIIEINEIIHVLDPIWYLLNLGNFRVWPGTQL